MAKRKQESGGFIVVDFFPEIDKLIELFPDPSKAFPPLDLSDVFPPIQGVFKDFDEWLTKEKGVGL